MGGSRVNLAFQVPARVFIVSKDFCASDFGASAFFVSFCAKIIVDSDTTTTSSVNRWDFMFVLLKNSFVVLRSVPGESHGFGESLQIGSVLSTVILNYNTMAAVKLFLLGLERPGQTDGSFSEIIFSVAQQNLNL